ncbi:MAG: LD-carboxypeptidase [Bdellovibrionaceae bacterium]|nr:LD-carboxypeptidase [Pseudobdellovibrionaceae bacterium]
MSSWKFLKAGDIVDVVSPGFASTKEEVEAARNFLLKWNLVPRIPKNLIQKHFLHSNSDEKRFGFLREAILAKDSKIVWCLRGGYGSNRLLPGLDKLKPKTQKLLVGISDITSLHVYFEQKWNWPTLHASLLDRMGSGKVPPKIEKETMDLLFGRSQEIEFKKLKPMNASAKNLKSIRSSVVGGNLIVLQSTLGTPYQVNTDGKILFIEDLGERGYRVDRVLEHFYQAGLFKKCKALIIGEFLGGKEESGKILWPQVFKSWADRLDIPVFSGMEAGHGIIQRPVPLMTKAVLTGGSRGHLVISAEGSHT